MDGSISFDSHSMQTYDRTTGVGIITDDIDLDSIANKDISMYGLAHANASTIPFINYPSKVIPATGTVVGSSAADLDSRLDTFRGYFTGQDKNLDIGYNGSTRRYIATVSKLSITRSANKKYASFSIEFTCTLPFGQDTASTTALNGTGRTAAVYTDTYAWLGSAPSQLPVATFTYSDLGATDGTNKVTNGTFEVDTSGWSANGIGTIARVTTQHHSGSAALQHTNKSSLSGSVYGLLTYDMTTLTAGQTYLASLWVKGNAGGEVIEVGKGSVKKQVTLTTSWQRVYILFTAAGGFDELYINAISPASGVWFVDDVDIEATISAQMFWGNDDTGQGITITRSEWAPGDIVIIDCANRQVTVNGADTDFSGAFPEFTPGSHVMSYSDTFTSRTMTENVVYNKRYM